MHNLLSSLGHLAPAKARLGAVLHETEHHRLRACKRGVFFYDKEDQFIGRALDIYGEWCDEEVELLSRLLRPGDVVVDVGAHIGTHAVPLARQVGQFGMVVALEPEPQAFRLLCANAALNEMQQLRALDLAAGAAEGSAALERHDAPGVNNLGAVKLNFDSDSGTLAQVIPLDGLALEGCNLIKVDVEGMEAAVLEGAASTIERYRPILYVENNRREGNPELFHTLRRWGYEAFWHLVPYFRNDNAFGQHMNVFSGFAPEANLLCLPDRRLDLGDWEPYLGPSDNWVDALRRIASMLRSRGLS
jgi:FkbM family methyltransferase